MDTQHVYVFRTITDQPEGSCQLEEHCGIYRSEGPAVVEARSWIELQRKELDDDEATIAEFVNTEGSKFVLTLRGWDGEWTHKAIVTREELK